MFRINVFSTAGLSGTTFNSLQAESFTSWFSLLYIIVELFLKFELSDYTVKNIST